MAKNYVVAGSFDTVDVVSQTEAIPSQGVKMYTQPHGTQVVVVVPNTAWKGGDTDSYLKPVATIIEQLWTDGLISGASWGQDNDPATGLLVGYMYFTVSLRSSTGQPLPFSTVVPVPVKALSSLTAFQTSTAGPSYGEQIAQAINSLAATASL